MSEHLILDFLHPPLECDQVRVGKKFFIGIQRLSQVESGQFRHSAEHDVHPVLECVRPGPNHDLLSGHALSNCVSLEHRECTKDKEETCLHLVARRRVIGIDSKLPNLDFPHPQVCALRVAQEWHRNCRGVLLGIDDKSFLGVRRGVGVVLADNPLDIIRSSGPHFKPWKNSS